MKRSILIQLTIAAVVIAIAVAASMGLSSRKPTARKGRTAAVIPLVETLTLMPVQQRVYIEAQGEVVAARSIDLMPEVSGKIIAVHPEFVAGGIIAKDATVLSLQDEDYALEVTARTAAVADAEYELTMEQAQQNIARRKWEFTLDDAPDVNRSIALREPQLKRLQARLQAAQSSLEAARLDLSRTRLRAPFNALIKETFANVGQLASPSRSVATLIGTDEFYVTVPVSLSELKWLRFPDPPVQRRGSRALITLEISLEPSDERIERQAEVYKLHASLSDGGSRARVMLRIEDPLMLKKGNPSQRILPGSIVSVRIEADMLDNVYVIPREALRAGQTLWILTSDGTLDIRPVSILRHRHDDVLLREGIVPGERLVMSRLQSPLPGMALRVAGDGEKPERPEGSAVRGSGTMNAPAAGSTP